MKIDFVSIGCLQESKLAGSIETFDSSNRLTLVLLHLSLHPADMILQPSPRMLEGVINGK